MKSFRKELWFKTTERVEFLNITEQVSVALNESGVTEGLCLVNSMHISSSVFINDDEKGLHSDFKKFLERLVPYEPISQYRHNDTGEDNADSHIRRQLFGREVVVAVTKGKLDFGPWEQIFYGEFEGKVATISTGGAGINMPIALEEGSLLTMTIRSPDGKDSVTVEGKIVWSTEAQNYGVSFSHLENGIQSTIQKWTAGLIKT